jgi:hypothetical protein
LELIPPDAAPSLAPGRARFQAKWMRPGGILLMTLAGALTFVILVMPEHDTDTIAGRCSAVLVNVIVGWYAFRACWRSALLVNEHGLIVRNTLTDIVVPWSQLDRVDVVPDDRMYLCTVDGQRIGVWALQTSMLSRLFGNPVTTVASQIEALRLGPGGASDAVQRHRDVREVRPLVLAYLALCVLLAVTNLG